MKTILNTTFTCQIQSIQLSENILELHWIHCNCLAKTSFVDVDSLVSMISSYSVR